MRGEGEGKVVMGKIIGKNAIRTRSVEGLQSLRYDREKEK